MGRNKRRGDRGKVKEPKMSDNGENSEALQSISESAVFSLLDDLLEMAVIGLKTGANVFVKSNLKVTEKKKDLKSEAKEGNSQQIYELESAKITRTKYECKETYVKVTEMQEKDRKTKTAVILQRWWRGKLRQKLNFLESQLQVSILVDYSHSHSRVQAKILWTKFSG